MEEKGGSSFFAEEALFSACDLRGGCVCGERARVHPHHPLYFLVMNLCLCVDKCSAAVDFWKGQGMMRNVAFFFLCLQRFPYLWLLLLLLLLFGGACPLPSGIDYVAVKCKKKLSNVTIALIYWVCKTCSGRYRWYVHFFFFFFFGLPCGECRQRVAHHRAFVKFSCLHFSIPRRRRCVLV